MMYLKLFCFVFIAMLLSPVVALAQEDTTLIIEVTEEALDQEAETWNLLGTATANPDIIAEGLMGTATANPDIIADHIVIATELGTVTVSPPIGERLSYQNWSRTASDDMPPELRDRIVNFIRNSFINLLTDEINVVSARQFSVRIIAIETGVIRFEVRINQGGGTDSSSTLSSVNISSASWTPTFNEALSRLEMNMGDLGDGRISIGEDNILLESRYTVLDDLWLVQVTVIPTMEYGNFWLTVTDVTVESINSSSTPPEGDALSYITQRMVRGALRSLPSTIEQDATSGDRVQLDHIGSFNFLEGELVLTLMPG